MIRRVAAVTLALMAVLALTGPASPAYADSSNNAAADRLAQMYSPIVVVRTQSSPCGAGEPYLPTSVGTVLGRTDVVLRGPGGQSIAAPTSADLAGKGEGWYLDLPGNPLDPGCSYEKWFHSVASGAPSTVYARVTTDSDHPGIVVLQYWFFWVFNDWNDKHEGDWEMIQLLFDAPDAEAALAKAPARVAFAQHEGSEVAVWSDPKLHTEGTHVAVYPGAGSHAAYYTQAQWFGKSAAAGFGCDNTLAPGTVVRPHVVLLPSTPTSGFEWLSFTGRWGEKAPSFNNGPTGPNTKTQWAHPVTWQDEQGRPDAVPLPLAGGPAVSGFCSLTAGGSLLFVSFLNSPGLVIGLGVLVVSRLVLEPGVRRRLGSIRIVGLAVLAGIAVLLVMLVPSLRASATDSQTFAWRQHQWKAAIDSIDNPIDWIIGRPRGSTRLIWSYVYDGRDYYLPSSNLTTHSLYFDALYFVGIVGLVLILALFVLSMSPGVVHDWVSAAGMLALGVILLVYGVSYFLPAFAFGLVGMALGARTRASRTVAEANADEQISDASASEATAH